MRTTIIVMITMIIIKQNTNHYHHYHYHYHFHINDNIKITITTIITIIIKMTIITMKRKKKISSHKFHTINPHLRHPTHTGQETPGDGWCSPPGSISAPNECWDDRVTWSSRLWIQRLITCRSFRFLYVCRPCVYVLSLVCVYVYAHTHMCICGGKVSILYNIRVVIYVNEILEH